MTSELFVNKHQDTPVSVMFDSGSKGPGASWFISLLFAMSYLDDNEKATVSARIQSLERWEFVLSKDDRDELSVLRLQLKREMGLLQAVGGLKQMVEGSSA